VIFLGIFLSYSISLVFSLSEPGSGKPKNKKRGAVPEEDAGTDGDDESEGTARPQKKRKKIFTQVNLTQSELKVFKGSDMPFTADQKAAVQRQFVRATLSANLPFRWTENLEIIIQS
jgi:hypothetical protein